MSQEKVDYHKEQKHNRKKLVKKQKRNRIIATTLTTVAVVLVVGFIGYSFYVKYEENLAANAVDTEVNISAITDYLSGLSEEDADSEE